MNLDSFLAKAAIKTNPAMIHIMSGDHDGDLLHVVLPTTKEGINDLIKMDIFQCIKENIVEFSPGKEIGKHAPEEWSNNPDVLAMQLDKIRRDSTNGQSISYHDLLGEPGTSYFDNTNVDREELAHFSHGITKEEVVDFTKDNVLGTTTRDAVRAFRIIKGLTPKAGAVSNALMSLAIAKTWDWGDRGTEIVRRVAHAKHIFCQDGLSAKHGSSTMEIANELFAGFYRSENNVLETREEYRASMLKFGLPEEDADAILEIFWNDPPVGVTEQLIELTPHYMATRRTAGVGLFQNMLQNKNERSLHKTFLDKIMEE